MYFKGFKIAISANFTMLLVAGMMLTNIVVTFFWQQHVIQLSIHDAKSYLAILSSKEMSLCRGNANQEVVLNEIGSALHNASLISLVMLRFNTIYPAPSSSENGARYVLQEAYQLKTPVTRTSGNFLSIFGLSTKNIIVAIPFTECDGIQALGAVVNIPQIMTTLQNKQAMILVYILVNAIILTTLWFFRARRLVISPLERLVNMAESYDLAYSDYVGSTARKNEFGQLADALKNMISRIEKDKEKLRETVQSLEEANQQILENQDTLIEAERFAAVGRLSAGLAHEIGNPLGIIQGYIELLARDDLSREDRKQYSSRADKELGRVTLLIQQLLEMARKKRDEKNSTRVHPVVHELLEMLSQQKSTNSITFINRCQDFPDKVQCSETELHQVLLNCILNSVDAVNEQNRENAAITISCTLIDTDSEQTARLVIEDNGTGIDPDLLSSIFDPFFTTKKVGLGTGLGLSVTRSIIENCGGAIRVESEIDKGTSIIIRLPVGK